MKGIKIEQNPGQDRLNSLGVSSWPIWTKAVSQFPWEYDETETCYFLEGEVIVTPDDGDPVKIGKGDLVTFPKGMRCTWQILRDVRKHYRFE